MNEVFGLTLFASGLFISVHMRTLRSKRRSNQRVTKDIAGKRIKSIEEFVQRDPGKRGIGAIIPPFSDISGAFSSHLEASAQAMLSCTHAIIMTGFPCMLNYTPPTETDGPLGALCLARCLVALGKKVHVITDECNEEAVLACAAASGVPALGMDANQEPLLQLESFPPNPIFSPADHARLMDLGKQADLIIAIERAGPSRDGRYLTMRARDMTDIVAPLDELLQPEGSVSVFAEPLEPDGREKSSVEAAMASKRAVSIGIGDGGNEVGMGAVYERILASSIPNAAEIACVVPTDHIIVASVSNWGGYALAAAAAMLATLSESSRLFDQPLGRALDACLPSEATELHMCERLVAAGARDGVTGKLEAWVDGMPMQESLDILSGIKQLALA